MVKTLWQVIERIRKRAENIPDRDRVCGACALDIADELERWAGVWAAFGDTLRDYPIQGRAGGTAQFVNDVLGLPEEKHDDDAR